MDDVFDSGRSIRAVIEKIKSRAGRNTPHQIKIACPWFKPTRNVTNLQPDFFIHTTDEWLVFPHELKGLTPEEISSGKGEDIARMFTEKPGGSSKRKD